MSGALCDAARRKKKKEGEEGADDGDDKSNSNEVSGQHLARLHMRLHMQVYARGACVLSGRTACMGGTP